MSFWLCIASDYQFMHVVLCKEDRIIESINADKSDSNKLLLTLIDQLLTKHHTTIKDLLYIGVNVGPGPYTSLRIAIATANGLAYATSLPLVSIDGLLTLLEEYTNPKATTIALLNAFNQDVFYGINAEQCDLLTGYERIDQLLERVQSIEGPLCFIGNGITLHYESIMKQFPHAQILQPIPEYASLSWLVTTCWQSWQNGESLADQLFPRYLKNLEYKNSISIK